MRDVGSQIDILASKIFTEVTFVFYSSNNLFKKNCTFPVCVNYKKHSPITSLHL